MIVAIALVAAVVAMLVAVAERRRGHGLELVLRSHLMGELDAARLRNSQLELMLDQVRTGQLEIDPPADRDEHLIVSAPGLRARASSAPATPPIVDVELSIDKLPERLRVEVRAIESASDQREYLETIQRFLAAGESVESIHADLFGE